MARGGLRLTLDIVGGSYSERFMQMEDVMARAATGAMDDAQAEFIVDGRASIAAAGFGRNWQNTLRATRFPNVKGKTSVTPALFIFHRIPYAGVFEEGESIKGSPLLWVPLPGTVAMSGGRNRITPSRFMGMANDPTVITSKRGNPLLAAVVKLPKTQATSPTPKVSRAALKRGKDSKRGVLRTIPMFVGIRNASHRKRFNIKQIAERVQSRLPLLYDANFKDD